MELNGFTDSLDLSVKPRQSSRWLRGRRLRARMNVRVQSGDVELALLQGARFELTAETHRGEAVKRLRRRVETRCGCAWDPRFTGEAAGAAIDISINRGRMIVRAWSGGGGERPFLTSRFRLPSRVQPHRWFLRRALPRPVEQ